VNYNRSVESAINFGTADSNQFCHPNSSFPVADQGTNYTLASWQKFSGQDANSTDINGYCLTTTVGGTISGLNGTVVLQNNFGSNVSLSTNGSFTFATAVINGNISYNVSVLTQPADQVCTVTNGSGNISSGSVSNISVTCTTNITSFDPISSIEAGEAGNAAYANAAAVVAALPTAVTANSGEVTIPVASWTDVNNYNPLAPGIYAFTAVLGLIPTGFINTSNLTATVNVVIAQAATGGGGGGGSSPIVSIPTSSPSSLENTATSSSVLRLINSSGTFFLIKNGYRYGITFPGILYSYGFEFKDAKLATAQDLALPLGSLLLPGNGSLVKSQKDPTVYLISSSQRLGFTSASVFLSLGFKWSSVLLVTNPELQALPQGSLLDNGKATHAPGLNILDHGTIYWLAPDHTRQAYPSLAVYNSWHRDNDFSQVVPANTADLALPMSGFVQARMLQ
jgi:hypothetical protein